MSNYKRRTHLTIDDVKKELSSDEQMLASAFKVEKIYRKHKFKIFIIIGITIAYFAGTAIMDNIAQNKREVANAAYLVLEKNPKDSTALNELKTNNPALYELFSYQEALKNSDTATLKTLSNNTNELISDLATYHLALLSNEQAESKYHEDMAKIYNASLLINKGEITEAKEELELISEESPIYNISKMIRHYSIKG